MPLDLRYFVIVIFLVLFVVPCVPELFRKLRSSRTTTRITVSPAFLKVHAPGKVTEIPSDEIEELSIKRRPSALEARSDKVTLTFASGLAREELAYLHALIRKILCD